MATAVRVPISRTITPRLVLPAGETDGTLRAYRLLAEVMGRTERAALGRFVMRTKVYLAAIRVRDGGPARRTRGDEGRPAHDERYWHGKVAQWRTASGETWVLSGSPNLSRPALLERIGAGGNCELALLSRIGHDLTPAEGDPPAGGLVSLTKPGADRDWHHGPVLGARAAASSENPSACWGSQSGASRTRTGDLLGAIQALSQLSYSPEVVPW